jgi:hypothetical protein
MKYRGNRIQIIRHIIRDKNHRLPIDHFLRPFHAISPGRGKPAMPDIGHCGVASPPRNTPPDSFACRPPLLQAKRDRLPAPGAEHSFIIKRQGAAGQEKIEALWQCGVPVFFGANLLARSRPNYNELQRIAPDHAGIAPDHGMNDHSI